MIMQVSWARFYISRGCSYINTHISALYLKVNSANLHMHSSHKNNLSSRNSSRPRYNFLDAKRISAANRQLFPSSTQNQNLLPLLHWKTVKRCWRRWEFCSRWCVYEYKTFCLKQNFIFKADTKLCSNCVTSLLIIPRSF